MINDDIEWFYSGSGTALTSLGGAISASPITSAADENLFQNISNPSVASKQYACVYLVNTGSIAHDIGLYIATPTPSNDTKVFMGNGASAIDSDEQSIADGATEPTGILWVQRFFDYNALSIALLNPGESKAVWLRLDQSANASGLDRDYCILTLKDI